MPEFILQRKKQYKSTDQFPKIRVSREIYEILAEIAIETGLPMSQIANKSISFAYENLRYKD